MTNPATRSPRNAPPRVSTADLRIEAVFLDFDGVVLDTAGVKTKAFATIFSDYPEHAEAALAHHVQNAGRPRQEKFRHLFETLLQERYTPEIETVLCDRFSAIVFDQAVRARFMPGTEDFLRTYADVIDIYVASATPDRELREIVAKRQMGHYFRGVFGSPRSKADTVIAMLAERRYDARRTVFVGDAAADLAAARQAAVPFVGMAADPEHPFGDLPVPTVQSLMELDLNRSYPVPSPE